MTPIRAVHIVREVAKALDYAHDRNVVHHDVKPANFLLANDFGNNEHVLLSDFGVARTIGDSDTPVNGLLTATLAYAAPEVIAGDPVDGRADLYSLGCTLFRLLTGKQPFYQARGESATARAHLDAAPPRVSDHLPWAPTQLDQVIAKALAKDPAKRFASAREFTNAAAEAIRGTAPASAAPLPSDADTSSARRAPRHRAEDRPTSLTPPPPAPSPGDRQEHGLLDQLGLPVINPKPAHRIPARRLLIGAVATAVITVVAGLAIWAMRPSPAPSSPTAGPSTSSAAPVNSEAQTRLLQVLPAGYPPGRCHPAATSDGAVAVVACGENIEPDGPSSATFTLARDPQALRAAFNATVSSSVTVICPGRIQSPGPWRHTADPTVMVGTVFCGTRNGQPLVAWTNDGELLLNVTQGEAPRPTLEQLYAWWTTHS
ncbi:serine/threonine-protein kinase [Mycobacterium sp. OAE908]